MITQTKWRCMSSAVRSRPRAADDVVRIVAQQRPVGRHLVEALLDDAERLAHLLHAHQVAVVDVAVRAERHLEVEAVVDEVRLRLADVVVHADAAQAGPVSP